MFWDVMHTCVMECFQPLSGAAHTVTSEWIFKVFKVSRKMLEILSGCANSTMVEINVI